MNDIILAKISKEELLCTLKAFHKIKIMGTDGLTNEFYLGLFYLIKGDILKVVQEFQSFGNMFIYFNRTFLVLIAKSQEAKSFAYFRPISCCNMIYKTVTKIIATRLKILPSEFIIEEKFGFLFNHQIHDTISLT
jgi:hypothetical protein